MEQQSIRLSKGTIYKKRYGSWFLINANRGNVSRMMVDEGADKVLLDLLIGNVVAVVADEHGYAKEDVNVFVEGLIAEGLIEYVPLERDPEKRCYHLDPPLDGINLLVTNKCNLHCAHCYANSGTASTSEMSGDEWINVIDQACELGVFEINVSGGEPLAHKDFGSIASHISAISQLHANLNTNGTLPLDGYIDVIARAFASIQISLDDSIPERHDLFRGQVGCFQRSVSSIRLLTAAGIETNVGFTITPASLNSLNSMVGLCESLGVASLHIGVVADTGRARLNGLLGDSHRQTFSDGFVRLLYEQLRLLAEYRGPLKLLLPFRVDQTGTSDIEKIRVCNGDITQIAYVLPDGTVSPCDKLPVSEFACGNIRNTDLRSIWTSQAMTSFKCKRLIDLGRCGACPLLQLCGGACPARAYHESNSILGSDSLACRIAQFFVEEKEGG